MWGVSSKLAGCLLGECNGRRGLVPDHLVLELHEPELVGAAFRSAGSERERERGREREGEVDRERENSRERHEDANDEAENGAHVRRHGDEKANAEPELAYRTLTSSSAAAAAAACALAQKTHETATERVESDVRPHYRRAATAQRAQRKMSSIARLESECSPAPLLPRDREHLAARGSPAHMLSPEHAALRPHANSTSCSRANIQSDVEAAATPINNLPSESPERPKRISFTKREAPSGPGAVVAATGGNEKTPRHRRQAFESAARSEASSVSSRDSKTRAKNPSTNDSPEDRSMQTSPSLNASTCALSQSELRAAHSPADGSLSECSLRTTRTPSATVAASRVRSLTVTGPPAKAASEESKSPEKGKAFGSDPSMLEKEQNDSPPVCTRPANGNCRATLHERRRKVSAAPFQIPKIVSETVAVTVEPASASATDRNASATSGGTSPTAEQAGRAGEHHGSHSGPGSRAGSAIDAPSTLTASGSLSALYRTWSAGSPARSPAESDPGAGATPGAGFGGSGGGSSGTLAPSAKIGAAVSASASAAASGGAHKHFNSCAYGGELLPQPALWSTNADGYDSLKRVSSTNELPPFELPIELDLSPRLPPVCLHLHVHLHSSRLCDCLLPLPLTHACAPTGLCAATRAHACECLRRQSDVRSVRV